MKNTKKKPSANSQAKIAAPEEDLMPLGEAAEFLYLSETTLRKGNCGTEGLVKIRQGDRVFFVRSQVQAHKRNLIQAALSRQERLVELAWRGNPSQNGFE